MNNLRLSIFTALILANSHSFATKDILIPKFSDFRVNLKASYPQTKLNTDSKLTKRFKTMLSSYLDAGPNFAGEYALASWGCGSSCLRHAIINVQNGRTFWPKEIEATFNLLSCSKDTLYFQSASKLLIVNKKHEDDQIEQTYMIWEKSRFKLVTKRVIREKDFCKE